MEFKARDYQIEDLSRLMTNPRSCLLQEPGTGKTFIAAMFTQYIHQANGEKIVWTQPGGIMGKNRRDILFSTNFTPEEVRIVQGTKAQREAIYKDPRVKVFLMSGVGYAKEWQMLPPEVRHSFHDEIHLYYTTHGANRTQDWYRASKNKGAIVPMTGTIIRGRLDSAYPILHVMAPMYYGNDRAFIQHHAWFDENGKVIGWKNHDRLKEVLRRIGIFRSFKSIYGQEKKVIQIERLELKPKARAMYQTLEQSGLIELSDEFVDAGNPAVAAMRARQILAAPEMFEIDEVPAKDDVLEVDIQDALHSGERIAIFSSITAEQERTVKLIQKLGGKVGHINGTVSYDKRQKIDEQFNSGELQFVVASPATAGIGFSWNFLNLLIYLTVDYMDDSFIQSYRRGIRGLRDQPLLIKILHYPDTIEERIFQIVDRKSKDHNLVNPDIEPLNLSQL